MRVVIEADTLRLLVDMATDNPDARDRWDPAVRWDAIHEAESILESSK